MELMAKLMLLAILVTFCSYARANQEGEENKHLDEEVKKEKFFFVASHVTTTYTALSIFTSATPYQCIIATNGQACTGRRKLRRKRRLGPLENLSADPTRLEVSEGEETAPENLDARGSEKFFFTVWKTTTTTATVTSFSTNRSITISFSARCSYVGINKVPKCG